jgi:hypothetical protein
MLRQLRELRGWSQLQLAVELERHAKRIGRSLPSRQSLVRMIRDWEHGTHRPRDYCDLLIGLVASERELAARTIEQGSDLDCLMTALSLMGISMERRKFLLNSAALAVGLTVERPADQYSTLDLFDDDPMPHAVGRLEYIQGLGRSGEPAAWVHQLLVRHSADLERLAARFPGSTVERELLSVQAWTLKDAGYAAFLDLGQHTAAEEHFHAAMQAAKRSSDPRLRAQVCVALAHRRVHDPSGDPWTNLHDALWAVNSGVRYAQDNPYILTDIYDMRAFIHSLVGDEHAAKKTLDDAAATISAAASGDAPAWLPSVTMAHVQETAGIACLRLGEPRLAAEEFSRALTTRANSGWMNRTHASLMLAWSAQASANLSEPERAVDLLQQAIPTVSTSKSVLRMQEIRTARAALQRWIQEPFVRELDEQLVSAGIAA